MDNHFPQHPEANELMALDLAKELDDLESLELYRRYATRFPHPMLREALNDVMAVPAPHIRKSRAALFTYLIKKYARQRSDYRH